MISSLIYFLWTNVDSVIVKWQIDISYFIVNIADIAAFWILGIIIFQATINILAKIKLVKMVIIVFVKNAVMLKTRANSYNFEMPVIG